MRHVVRQIFGHIETNSSCPNNGDFLPNGLFVVQDIGIVHHLWVVNSFYVQRTWTYTGSEDNLIIASSDEVGLFSAGV